MPTSRVNLFVKLAFVIFAAFCVFSVVRLQIEYNALQTAKAQLEEDNKRIEQHINELNNEANTPLDDDYVIKTAKEKFNLRLPEEIVFYNDLLK